MKGFRITSRTVTDSASTPNNSVARFVYDDDDLLDSAQYDPNGVANSGDEITETLSNDSQNGLLTGTTLGVVSDTYDYIPSGQTKGFGELLEYEATSSGTPVFKTVFERDKLGRITKKTETLNNITTNIYDYTYDTAGRLDTVTKNTVLQNTYTYDGNSNRLNNGAVYDNQDRLTSTSTATYTYTANGELLTKTVGSDVTTYTYDVLGNLRNVDLPNTTDDIEYLIDGRNRRIGKKVGGTLEQQWLYKDQLNPVAELDGSGNITKRFIYASRANVPDIMVIPTGLTNAGTYRIVSDHLGSPRFVIDISSGSTVQALDYDEWGNVLSDTNPGFQPFGYAGGLYDQDTKLVRFGARDYDPEIGRWTSKDPIRFDGDGPNLYGYTLNDPINNIDSTGKLSAEKAVTNCAFGFGLVGSIVGGLGAGTGCGVATAGGGFIPCGVVGATAGFGVGIAAGIDICTAMSDIMASTSDSCPANEGQGGDDGDLTCDEHFTECLGTSLQDIPGEKWGHSRCMSCRNNCVQNDGKWPDLGMDFNGSIRCDYWSF